MTLSIKPASVLCVQLKKSFILGIYRKKGVPKIIWQACESTTVHFFVCFLPNSQKTKVPVNPILFLENTGTSGFFQSPGLNVNEIFTLICVAIIQKNMYICHSIYYRMMESIQFRYPTCRFCVSYEIAASSKQVANWSARYIIIIRIYCNCIYMYNCCCCNYTLYVL